jgi:hypothetical protein
VVDLKDVERALTNKLGARRDPSGHHIFFYLDHQGCTYTVGKVSHSWRGHLNDTQISMMARKLRLQRMEFENFVDCSLDACSVIRLFLARIRRT